jgi:ABC-2 type transport system ATP-binding protein
MIRLECIRARISPDFRIDIPELRLKPGITVLVGPNGAGKSSLLRLLATVTESDGGEVTYSGHRLRDSLPLIRRNIGYMPAGLALYEGMTVVKLLRHLGELKGLRSGEALTETIEELGLSELACTKIRRLSHGQRQRVGIAQAMLGEPPFLFLDEPLNYLDALEQKRVQFALLRRAKKTVILVSTHELNEWESYADRVIWLENGKVAEDLPLAVWKKSLPPDLGVYEGRMPLTAWQRLLPERVLRVRIEDGSAYIRVLGPPPTAWFKAVEPTMEDAYLIRRMNRSDTQKAAVQPFK